MDLLAQLPSVLTAYITVVCFQTHEADMAQYNHQSYTPHWDLISFGMPPCFPIFSQQYYLMSWRASD